MVFIFITWVIIAWGTAACVYMLWGTWSRFPRRDFDDVVHFLYPVDLSLAESLLDPAAEFESSWRLSPEQFREVQRKRVALYLELVRRMAHNSRVLVEFGNEELTRNDPRSADTARTLQKKAVEVRIGAVLTMLKVRYWMWVRPNALNHVPAIPQLRRTADVDVVKTYGALKGVAAAAFMHLQPGEIEMLTRNL